MRIVIAGGTGQIGRMLGRAFERSGDSVVVLSRSPGGHVPREIAWDGRSDGGWMSAIDGADVVIDLAGRSVDCRSTRRNRRAILESRVDSTRAIARAIERAVRPPRVWLQASTATIYAHRFDAPNDEATGIIGGGEPGAPRAWDFSIDVARAWEAAADEAAIPHTRLVKLRSAMTMSHDRGGIFDALLRLVRFGLGGSIAGGRQYVSWIHETDFVAAIRWIIAHDELAGVVNVCAPEPLPYREFIAELRGAWGARFGLPATSLMVKLGTFLLGTESELVLKSRRVIPARLVESGFEFRYETWDAAASNLCDRWRESHGENSRASSRTEQMGWSLRFAREGKS